MNRANKDFIEKALDYVLALFDDKLSAEYIFHSKAHTKDVLKKSLLIGKEMNLSAEELDGLALAAIFHDSGYLDGYHDHESRSAEIAEEFLTSNGMSESIIEQVKRAISSTRVPQKPVDRVSEALCDADLMHLGEDDYFETMELLRTEWIKTGRQDLSELEFHKQSVDFFNNHKFHTSYGQRILLPKKVDNLFRIKERIRELSS